jgi:hypothetical protein
MAADAEATLPSLIETVKRSITADRHVSKSEAGRWPLPSASARSRAHEATYAWDAADQHRAIVSRAVDADQGQRLGAGVTDRFLEPVADAPGRSTSRISKSAPREARASATVLSRGRRRSRTQEGRTAGRQHQADGDLICAPGVLWTSAPTDSAVGHAQQPRLPSGGHAHSTHGQPASAWRDDGGDRHDDRHPASITLGWRSLGVHAEGPISDPKDLAAAFAGRSMS